MLALSHASRAGPHEVVDRGRHLGIVEPFLGLPLEHRLAHEDRQDADDALADVLGGDGQALGLDLVRLHVVADRLDDAALEAVLVRAAGRGADAVDVGADRSRRSTSVHCRATSIFSPLPCEQWNGVSVTAGFWPSVTSRLQKLRDAAGMRQVERLLGDLVLEGDLQAAVDVGHVLEVGLDPVRVELRGLEDVRVGLEVDGGAVAAERAELFELGRPACRA